MSTRYRHQEKPGPVGPGSGRRPARRFALLCLAAASLALGGCATLDYYAQAVLGHLDLMQRSRPIDDLLTDPDTPESHRTWLARVNEIRDFASRELALPENGSYRAYADIGRDAVVWSLVATPEFSVEPVQWCYPVVGCASYRGYFDRRDAQAHADRLAAEGRDVAVLPVPAYSTLGWLDDPLPSTVSAWSEPLLAGLIFHELAHQRFYLKGDSAFNESFATAVERAGVSRWLERAGDQAQSRRWGERQGRQSAFVSLLLGTRERLLELYSRPLAPERLRGLKEEEFARLRASYRALKSDWGGYAGFDGWFEAPLNNARIASVGTYERWTGAFLALLERERGEFGAFFRSVEALSGLPAAERRARLEGGLSGEPTRDRPSPGVQRL